MIAQLRRAQQICGARRLATTVVGHAGYDEEAMNRSNYGGSRGTWTRSWPWCKNSHPRRGRGLARRELLAGLAGGAFAAAAPAPKIRLGCQTRAYGSPIPDRAKLLSVLDDLRDTGYEGFETNYRSLEYSFQNPAPMREEIEKRGVALIGLHMGASLFDPAKLESEQAQISQMATTVKALGGTHLMLSVRALPLSSQDRIDQEAEKRRNIQLTHAGRVCRDLGIRLAAHNHLQQSRHNGQELKTILNSTSPDCVSLLLDVAYTFMGGADTVFLVRQYGQRIAGFHLRDIRGDKEVAMGSGEVDFSGLGRVLEETLWSGWCILEINSRPGVSSRDRVRKARTYLRKAMNI